MKPMYRVFLLVFLCLVFSTIPCYAVPELFMPQQGFSFDPVPDGTVITHDYIVKNQGNEPLEILEIGTT